MPVRWSSSNGGANKGSTKVRVAVGNSKGSGDSVKTLRPTSSNVDKALRKPRVGTRGTKGSWDADAAVDSKKGSGDSVKTLRPRSSNVDKALRKPRVGTRGTKGSRDDDTAVDFKKNGSKKMKSRGNDDDAVSYINMPGETRGRRKMVSNTKSGHEGFETGNSSQKRKRIFADPRMVEDRMFDKKSSSKSKNNGVRLYLDKSKKVLRGKDRELKDTSRNTSLTRRSKSTGRSNSEGADKPKHVRESGLGNRPLETSDKRKAPLATKKDLNQRTYAFASVEKHDKKKNNIKKTLGTDSEFTEGPPLKKKKRGIRIDPHDVSNKRLDGGMANAGSTQAKQDLEPGIGVEMSKNAQFRAIRPSSSILSFVEDNLLGRRRDIEFRRAGYNTELSAPLDNIPSSTSSERERIEVPVFRNNLEFFAAAKISSSFPSAHLPEIAFAGRSNVGKSSLLNALTRQWGVVRTSDKPGLTQTINFFKLGSKLSLVDLPGYGFAYAKEEVKEAWEELVKEYVTTRVGLERVCVLVDTKWGMKSRDLELIDLMERSQTKYQIVLTKTDLVFPIDVARRAMQVEENLKAKKSAIQPLMMVSSKTGAGIRSLRTVLANVSRLVRR